MKLNFPLVALFFYFALCVLAEQSELSRQSDAHQMFLLRDEVSRHPGSTDFYSAEIACAFNDTATCEERFKKVIAVEPNSIEAKQVHHTLAYALFREGRYDRAFREIDALLAIDPKDADAKDTRPFFEALSHFPDQAVQESGTSKATVQMDGGKLPLLINGKNASYFFDTGANLSTLSQSEALRLGMEIKDVNVGGGAADVNGNKVLFRVALAKSLALGGMVLNNVGFLVAGNEQQPFVDMEPGQRGLIGLPVLRAFGSIKWNREGVVGVDRSPTRVNMAAANLCFDDLSLIAEAWFEQHALPFVLDTGATTTDLWPKFAGVAGNLIRKSGTRESHTVTGMGGSQEFDATSIPKVILRLGGRSVTLQPAHILKTQQKAQTRWFYGNLGIDLLGQAQDVAIDFRTMTLELDPDMRRRLHTH
jgi:tetratricopeptide (TPR) repeat protein